MIRPDPDPTDDPQARPSAAHQSARGSLLLHGAWLVFHGARQGWRELPPGAFRRWLVLTLIGAALALAFTAALTQLAKRIVPGSRWEAWDREVILAANDWSVVSYTNAIIFESPGNILIMLPLTLAAAVICFANRRLLWGLSLLVCYGWARLLILLGWELWDRARPDLIGGGAASLKTHTFPSGHVLLVFTTYGLLAHFWIISTRSWLERALAIALLLAVALVVSLGRIRLGAHWPTDLIGGALMGVFWLLCTVMALEAARRSPAFKSSDPHGD